MRFREPLLGGSTAMPGASLQRACRLLVAVCALHLGVTLVYYLAGRDLSRLPQLVGVATSLQGGSSGGAAATSGQPSGELKAGGVRPPLPLGTFSEPRRGHDSSPGADAAPGPASNLTSVPVLPTTALLLPVCPEESPLLGKDSGRCRSEGLGLPGISPDGVCRAFPGSALLRDGQAPYSGSESRLPSRLWAGWGREVASEDPLGVALAAWGRVGQPAGPSGPGSGEGLGDVPALVRARLRKC